MLTCDEVATKVHDFVAGALSTDEHDWVERHLECCASCRAAADRVAEPTDRALAATTPISPPANFEASVMERLRAEQSAQPPAPPE